jgi:predicted nuclease of predicted toxin-antitoxin system
VITQGEAELTSLAEDDEWFPFEADLIVGPGTQPSGLKLCADASIPKPFVDELRDASISIRTALEDGVNRKADQAILSWARRLKRVLVTLDRDFWNDQKFPLQKTPGSIFIDVSPDKVGGALEAFWLVYETFARFCGNWREMKIRATPGSYFIKGIGWDGRKVRYEVRVEAGQALARELSSIDR